MEVKFQKINKEKNVVMVFIDKEKMKKEAYEKFLKAILGYLQGKKIINYKQSAIIMKYVRQNESDKKKIKYSKIEKILGKILKESRKRGITSVPKYEKLKGPNSWLKGISEEMDQELEAYIRHRYDRDIESFTSLIIDRVKDIEEKNRTEVKKEKSETKKKEERSKSKSLEIDKKAEERNLNDFSKISTIMKKEEEIFDSAYEKEENSTNIFGSSDTHEEYMRKKYLKRILSAKLRLKNHLELDKKINVNGVRAMLDLSKEIEKLIVENLTELNISPGHSEIFKQTLLKEKYNPRLLLEQYKKNYESYLKQFKKLPEEKQVEIEKVCKEKGLKFIPSSEDIVKQVNEKIIKEMVENEVGTSASDFIKLTGTHGLTSYMDLSEAVHGYKSVRDKITEKYDNALSFEKKELAKRNLQKNFCQVVSEKGEQNMYLTDICQEYLKEEPVFEEPKRSEGLIVQNTKRGITFSKIKDAIAKKIHKKQKEDNER